MELIKKIIKNKIRVILLMMVIVAVPFFSGCKSTAQSYVVNLEIWGPFDDALVYTEIINQYKKINPYVGEIKYKSFNADTYKQQLIDALAGGQGPDIFLINNAWFPYFENKIYPAPTPFVSEQDVKNVFPDVVAADFVSDNKVYAVPLSVDSLQLYYNKDMFNAAGIVAPPRNWQEFQDDVQKLTIVDQSGEIIRSGAAIGTAQNIDNFSDILSVLMLQNGVTLPMKRGEQINFDEGVMLPDGNVVQAGEQALGFYAQFSKLSTVLNTRNPVYTWNFKQSNSLDEFAGGSVAMMFGYARQNSIIKNRNPKLNYASASLPQRYADKSVTVANYWGYAVSLNKIISTDSTTSNQATMQVSNDMRTHEAWQFLRFLTLKNSGMITLYNAITKNSKDFPINFDPALDYLTKTKQPAARRDIIETQKNDMFLGSFAVGNLIAKNWYQKNPEKVDAIFANMIESVNNSGISLHEALLLARNRINGL